MFSALGSWGFKHSDLYPHWEPSSQHSAMGLDVLRPQLSFTLGQEDEEGAMQ
jgi:hypothetical protein